MDKQLPKLGNQKITPFLWFDNNAEEAAHFYVSVFPGSEITTLTRYGNEGAKASGQAAGSVMTVAFCIEGFEMVAINGGPVFEINPSVSFFVNCKLVNEIDTLWAKLSDGGEALMELDKYPFAEKYGWVQDRYGVSWQLIIQQRPQKITPCFMFSGVQHLMAEKAIGFYTSVFNDSEVLHLERYVAGQGPEGAVVHGKFTLAGQEFVAMDSHAHMPIDFNPALSMVVSCNNQSEIDHFWEKLSQGGNPAAQQCGWLEDKFGLSWQVIPSVWVKIMSKNNPDQTEKAMKAILGMKKIDLDTILKAIEQ
jgi:predicted 3-demethylubiquinone-9 3-methyltransferase (glyoxalase superfamily)